MRITLNDVEYRKEGIPIISKMSCQFTTGITYVVGKNGAGKSTLLKMLATALQPTKGKINYTQLSKQNEMGLYRKILSMDEIRTKISYMPQMFTGHPTMSIKRYLTYMAYHKGIPHAQVQSTIENWLRDMSLFEGRNKKLHTLSGGQLQKVGLIQALINRPRICILDEPYESLDIAERLAFQHVIQRLSFHSVVIISTHIIEEMRDGDLLYLQNGAPLFHGSLAEGKRTDVLQNLYRSF